MRLLGVSDLQVIEVRDDDVPPYAILSHTWGRDEVSLQDLELLKKLDAAPSLDLMRSQARMKATVLVKSGYAKIAQASAMAKEYGYDFIWIDTCCIDKTSSAELSEAINSMFQWYQAAGVCFAYLRDAEPLEAQDPAARVSKFRASRWFTRGWTLQELIAPRSMIFFAKDWTFIGNKADRSFVALLSQVTGVDERVLNGSLSPLDVSVANRMKWAALRETTRVEDMAYCLLGLYDVNMPLLYGEGRKAFVRLQEEILKQTDDQSLFAWAAESQGRYKMQDADQLHGLLATSPAQFGNIGITRTLPPLQTQDSVPSSMTNQGLRVHLYLRPHLHTADSAMMGEQEYLAILDCTVRQDGMDMFPTIILRKLWGDQFARIRAQECLLLKDPKDGKVVPEEGYQTIYIKQKPRYILPEFTIRSKRRMEDQVEIGLGLDDVYQVRDVYPPENWDPHSLVLAAKALQSVAPLAILRFEDEETHVMTVDVAVGLSRTQGRWQAWCRQFPAGRLQLHEVYKKLHQDDPDLGTDRAWYLPTTATVEETRRHGRPYMLLEVLGKPEIGGSAEINTIDEGGVPSAVAVDIRQELEDGLKRLLSSCTVALDAMANLFPGPPLTNKVRIRDSKLGPHSVPRAFETLLETLDLTDVKSRMIVQLCKTTADGPDTASWPAVTKFLHDEKQALTEKCEEFHDFQLLHFATAFGNTAIMEALLGEIVDANLFTTTTAEGWTIAHIAALLCSEAHLDILATVVRRVKARSTTASEEVILGTPCHHTLETPLHFAAAYSPPTLANTAIKLLLDEEEHDELNLGVRSLRVRNYLDETPLHRACATGNLEAVKALIRLGPESVTEVDRFGRSAVWHAACAGHAAIVRLLVQRLAPLDLSDDEGRSPLHAACREGRHDAVEALLERDANLDASTQGVGFTAAHFAALFGHVECLQLLVDAEADVRKTTAATGVVFEAVHLAAANGHAECVDVLLKAGCDAFARCTHYVTVGEEGEFGLVVAKGGQTVEEVAKDRGYTEIVSRIKQSAGLHYDWGTGMWRREMVGGKEREV